MPDSPIIPITSPSLMEKSKSLRTASCPYEAFNSLTSKIDSHTKEKSETNGNSIYDVV